MTRALIYKEFRETLPIALVGLAVLVVLGGTTTTSSPASNPLRNLLNDRLDGIPFVSDAFTSRLTIVASVLAMALGFWQTLGDFHRDAQLFLLHRPVTR